MSGDLITGIGESSSADSPTQINSCSICEPAGLITSSKSVSTKLNSQNHSTVLEPTGIPTSSKSPEVLSGPSALKSVLGRNVVSKHISSLSNTPSVPSPTRLKTRVPTNMPTLSPPSKYAVTRSIPSKRQPGRVVAENPLNRGNSRRFREYHPDKHCGVWDVKAKRHCTRALTCKSHSILLKRKIAGRSQYFDELVYANKRAQAAAQSAAKERQEQQLVAAQQVAAPQTAYK